MQIKRSSENIKLFLDDLCLRELAYSLFSYGCDLCFKPKLSKQKGYKHALYFQKKSSKNHISFSDDLSLLCFDAYKVP